MFAISCLLVGYSQASDETAGQGAATSPGQVSEETAGVPDVPWPANDGRPGLFAWKDGYSYGMTSYSVEPDEPHEEGESAEGGIEESGHEKGGKAAKAEADRALSGHKKGGGGRTATTSKEKAVQLTLVDRPVEPPRAKRPRLTPSAA